jgi:hypothetical protein
MEDSEAVGAALEQAGLISSEQRRQVLQVRQEIGGTVDQIVVKLGFMEEGQLVGFMARQHNMKVAEIADLILPENLIKRVPRRLIEKHTVLPIAFREGLLTIATANPYDLEAIGEIQMAINSRVEVQLARRTELVRAINELFYGEGGGVAATGDTTVRSPVARLHGMLDALAPLLIEKGVITEEELALKARELGIGAKPRETPPA